MLAKEKRVVIRSIAVGIVASGLVAGFCTWQVHQAEARLEALRRIPTDEELKPVPAAPPLGPAIPADQIAGVTPTNKRPKDYDPRKYAPVQPDYDTKKFEPVPAAPARIPRDDELTGLPPAPPLPGSEASDEYIEYIAQEKANKARDNRWFFSLLTLATFSLPLVWYLFLDRLREVSAAISGRDKSNLRPLPRLMASEAEKGLRYAAAVFGKAALSVQHACTSTATFSRPVPTVARLDSAGAPSESERRARRAGSGLEIASEIRATAKLKLPTWDGRWARTRPISRRATGAACSANPTSSGACATPSRRLPANRERAIRNVCHP